MTITALALILAAAAFAGESGIEPRIDAALSRVRRLKIVDYEKTYELSIRGKRIRLRGIELVDRRTGREVLESGLSTGCGDHAHAFYELIGDGGLKRLYLHAADASVANLLGLVAAGHSGVAVQDPRTGRWTLVDPTGGEILSRDWDPASKLYGRRWIGFVGKAEGYFSQITAESGVGEFFERTLKAAPRAALEDLLIGIDFELGSSMIRPDGRSRNPKARRFAVLYSGLDRRLGFMPKKRVTIRLEDLNDKPDGVMCSVQGADFVCAVGRRRDMDDRLFTWIEDSAAKHAPQASSAPSAQ